MVERTSYVLLALNDNKIPLKNCTFPSFSSLVLGHVLTEELFLYFEEDKVSVNYINNPQRGNLPVFYLR